MNVVKTPVSHSKSQVSGLEKEHERVKRFIRKPGEHSERSSSKKSTDSAVKEIYIKSPTSISTERIKQFDFFTVLAQSIRVRAGSTEIHDKETHSPRRSQRNSRVHEVTTSCFETGPLPDSFKDQDKERTSKKTKELSKSNEKMKLEVKRFQKEKEHLTKQIEFLEKISFDEKTRGQQSYREKFLEEELEKVRREIQKSKDHREEELESKILSLKEEKFTIESHYKAMKVVNESLIKQLKDQQDNIHDLVLNSVEYRKLKDKYILFLQEYKTMRNDYWSLKSDIDHKRIINNESSSLFSMTLSISEQDLSKNDSSVCVLGTSRQSNSPIKNNGKNEKSAKLEDLAFALKTKY